jgi:hypothetical protein
MGFGVGTARTALSTATIFMDSSPGLSQRISHRVKAAALPGRPPYNGFAMPERTILDKVWARPVVAIGSGGRTLRLMEGRGQ